MCVCVCVHSFIFAFSPLYRQDVSSFSNKSVKICRLSACSGVLRTGTQLRGLPVVGILPVVYIAVAYLNEDFLF